MLKYLLSLSLLAVLIFNAQAQTNTCGPRYQDSLFAEVNVTTVAYGQNRNYLNQNQILRTDIYQPVGDTARNRALVILLFGGGFISGSRSQDYIVMAGNYLAKRGYVAAGIDYRIGIAGVSSLELSKTVYRATQDSKAAVRFFRSKADSLGIHPEKIFLMGFSAGAITAIQTAYWQQHEVPSIIDTLTMGSFQFGSGTPFFHDKPNGVVSCAGAIGDTSWINLEAVPLALWHNRTDNTVPYGAGIFPVVNLPIFGSGVIQPRMERLGNPSVLMTRNVTGMHVPPQTGIEADTFAHFAYSNLARMVCEAEQALSTPIAKSFNSIYLYPQPAGDIVHLANLPEGLLNQSNPSAQLFSTDGRFLTLPLQPSSNGQASINLQGLAKGPYFVRIFSDSNGKPFSFKLLKN